MKSTSRHVPQRTCVACRQVKPKRELVRLVHTAGGSVLMDAGGKQAGRGAYLCPEEGCWELGLKSGRLAYALRTALTGEDREQIISCIKAMNKERD